MKAMKVIGLLIGLMAIFQPTYAGVRETIGCLKHPEIGVYFNDSNPPEGLSIRVWSPKRTGVQAIYEKNKESMGYRSNYDNSQYTYKSETFKIRCLKGVSISESAIFFLGIGWVKERGSTVSSYTTQYGPGLGSLAGGSYTNVWESKGKREKVEYVVGSEVYLGKHVSFSGEISYADTYNTEAENFNFFTDKIQTSVGIHLCF